MDVTDHGNCFRLWTRGRHLAHGDLLIGRYEVGSHTRRLTPLTDMDDVGELYALTKRIERRMAYLNFLETDTWDEIRDAAIAAADGRCQLCNRPDPTHGHHRTYERFGGNELPGDVIALCDECHHAFHKNRTLWKEPIPASA